MPREYIGQPPTAFQRRPHLTRDEAMERGREYSKPRWASIREYAQLIGFSAEEALQIINAAPKRY